MRALDPNFTDLLRCLNAAGVRYLLIGGYAVNYHGYHRNTADMDVWIAVDPQNADRVSAALVAFGFPPSAVAPQQFTVPGDIHSFGRKPFRVDLVSSPDGVDFETCYARRVDDVIDGVNVSIIGLDDLKANKKASGRLKDQADLENLPPSSIV